MTKGPVLSFSSWVTLRAADEETLRPRVERTNDLLDRLRTQPRSELLGEIVRLLVPLTYLYVVYAWRRWKRDASVHIARRNSIDELLLAESVIRATSQPQIGVEAGDISLETAPEATEVSEGAAPAEAVVGQTAPPKQGTMSDREEATKVTKRPTTESTPVTDPARATAPAEVARSFLERKRKEHQEHIAANHSQLERLERNQSAIFKGMYVAAVLGIALVVIGSVLAFAGLLTVGVVFRSCRTYPRRRQRALFRHMGNGIKADRKELKEEDVRRRRELDAIELALSEPDAHRRAQGVAQLARQLARDTQQRLQR
jgi:hypothetical protein